MDAALQAGCRRFDGAIKGFGGCPMATDKLTGNMPTELMVGHLRHLGYEQSLDQEAFTEALRLAADVFSSH
jgi:hydroxymethylglutaryl-CoA lyase